MSTYAPSGIRATYRLQIHAGFSLLDAARVVPYLARLGVSHVYSSPLLAARAGSTHGYDVVDPTVVSAERGGQAGLMALHEALRRHAMGLVLDIVPNHMGTGAENPRWDDLLAHGRSSRFAHWFDVDWDGGGGRIVLPLLGAPLREVLASGALRVVYDPPRGLRLRYFEHDLPIDPGTAAGMLGRAARRTSGTASTTLAAIATELRALPPRHSTILHRAERSQAAVEGLAALAAADPEAAAAVAAETAALSDTAPRGALAALLDAQAYRLVHWRRGGRLVNYRRFFNIADLAAVRVEDDEVFDATHALVLDWVAAGIVDGLRIDHVDGLWNPRRYLARLSDAVAAARPDRATPIWVEKILCGDEQLRSAWPVAGTTGYEFLNAVESVLIDPVGYAHLEPWYRRRTAGGPRRLELGALVDGAKRRVLGTWLAADVTRLARDLRTLLADAGGPRDVTVREAERAVVETIVGLPVYRTYVEPEDGALDPEDVALAARAARAAERAGRARADVVHGLARLVVGDTPAPAAAAARRFTAAFQQLSSPAMAKGFEDTALYAFVALASRNEVGGDPAADLAGAAARLHAANAARAAAWPGALLATSTHDTKRSGDVRARLDVLAEIAPAWTRTVARWRRMNRRHRTRVGRRFQPDDNTEYLLYQSLIGIWPCGAAPVTPALRDRLATYSVKAAREAKVHTSWLAPAARFEAALLRFLGAVLADGGFVAAVDALVRRLDASGRWNALARTLVHLTAPGVPDLYQGDELWTFALADPDNRRAVDFAARDRLLATLERSGAGASPIGPPDDDAVKLHVVRTALGERRRTPATFARGSYDALDVSGVRATHAFAFARRHGDDVSVTVVPRFVQALAAGTTPVGARVWGDTTLGVAGLGGRVVTNRLTGERHAVASDGTLPLAGVLATFPLALLRGEP